MAQQAKNRMEIQTQRLNPKQVLLVVTLSSDLADTVYLTIDETQSETAMLEGGTARLEFTLPDEQSKLHLHTLTAEFFAGETPESCGAVQKEIAT
ncbi:MAG: hypothetical protein LKH04_05700 [Lachnospiraceae bacterium]|jgi:hypothetical protein|nr:hypothetical protein [Lachnospiraceae bacterium]MCI1399077.1 hypothetical protein [Lachnospiraceae bacterium]MCI1423781.1 hypothetical protein [Lachnospiraceae bacterium]MCI1452565.1 hypothetical protein [Lachnospiraceae bacterium]MDD5849428.1 hypothetical protein [Bacillota bacterium]